MGAHGQTGSPVYASLTAHSLLGGADGRRVAPDRRTLVYPHPPRVTSPPVRAFTPARWRTHAPLLASYMTRGRPPADPHLNLSPQSIIFLTHNFGSFLIHLSTYLAFPSHSALCLKLCWIFVPVYWWFEVEDFSLSFQFVKSSLCSRKNGQQRQHHLRFRFRWLCQARVRVATWSACCFFYVSSWLHCKMQWSLVA